MSKSERGFLLICVFLYFLLLSFLPRKCKTKQIISNNNKKTIHSGFQNPKIAKTFFFC